MAASEGDERMNGMENGKSSMDQQLERVFSLVESRSRGAVADDDVENAVSALLARSGAIEHSEIQQDTDDYDNVEEEEPSTRPPDARTGAKLSEATVESLREDNEVEEDPLDQIPLGREGARMMITFGDGHKPKPETVSAALLGARRCLHVAIRDARALRRHEKDEFMRARKAVLMSQKHYKRAPPTAKESAQEAAGAGMLYRAMKGRDKLAKDLKCGFDAEQLKQLFPEEMRVYLRWTEMHQAYQDSGEDTGAVVTNEKDGNDAEESGNAPADKSNSLVEGHLEERTAQFDARTKEMKDDWYMKFSVVRQGSFLPKKAGKRTQEDRQWEETRKRNRTVGRSKHTGNWESMPALYVRFLHWVGFAPGTELPPPDEDTTDALAFLGYDFMGRIVEKAIYLRNVSNKKEGGKELLELQEDEQLTVEDIERAINDSSVRPVPLFGRENSSHMPVAAQLYFGPGFEDRLEMEMDELASGGKRKLLPPEEEEVREREDELFARLADAPVVLDGLSQIRGKKTASQGAPKQDKKADGGR